MRTAKPVYVPRTLDPSHDCDPDPGAGDFEPLVLKGDRYTVSPCLEKFPPLDEGVKYDSVKAGLEAGKPQRNAEAPKTVSSSRSGRDVVEPLSSPPLENAKAGGLSLGG